MSTPRHTEETLREWLNAEPFTLSLSAGFFGFYAHAGFLSALRSEGLRPAGIRGCSAGALVGGLWASGRNAQDITEMLTSIQRRDFWDPGFGLGLLKGALFQEILENELAVQTFDETTVPLAVSVFRMKTRETISVHTGDLATAIRASCTFPGLFQPVTIDGQWYIDGGVQDRAGHHGLATGERVFHHHLASRSRARKGSKHVRANIAPNMATTVIHGLPAVGPFHMERGKQAYRIAYDSLAFALDQPAVTNQVHSIGPGA